MTSIGRVLEKWRAGGVDLLPPCDMDQVVTVIESLGQLLSRDVRELYALTAGMEDGVMDELCFSLWPLDRVVVENRKRPVPGVLFADFLIDSHLYLFRYQHPDVSTVHIDHVDGRDPQRVAGSVFEFFELYLNRPEQVGLYEDEAT